MMTAVTHFEVDADAYEVVIRDPPRSYDRRRPDAVSMKNEKSVSVGVAASVALISLARARREHVLAAPVAGPVPASPVGAPHDRRTAQSAMSTTTWVVVLKSIGAILTL